MNRVLLVAIAAGLAIIGAVSFGAYIYKLPTVLRVAVARDSEDAKLIVAAEQYLRREHESVRFKVEFVRGAAASAAMLENDQADLAVVRSDIAMPTSGQTAIVLHKSAAILIAPGGSSIAKVSDLGGRNLGLLLNSANSTPNQHLVDALLEQYEVLTTSVKRVPVALEDVGEAIRSGRIDALLAVGVPSSGRVGDAVNAVAQARDGALIFVPITEAGAIAQRDPVFESMEIVRGTFGGSSPKPAEAYDTLAVSNRLVVKKTLRDGLVGDLVRILFAAKPKLAESAPLANKMEAPSTDKDSALPVHPGAAAFLDDEVEGFFDRYSDFIYLGAMVLSAVGSGLAAVASRMTARSTAHIEGLMQRLLQIHRATREAPDVYALDALERETDEIVMNALAEGTLSGLDSRRVSVLSLALQEVRLALVDRRKAIGAAADGVTPLFPRNRVVLAGE